MAASRSAQIPRMRLYKDVTAKTQAPRSHSTETSCPLRWPGERSIASPARISIYGCPRPRHAAAGNRRHRRRAARPDPPPRRRWSTRSRRPSPLAGWRSGPAAKRQVLRKRLAAHEGAFPAAAVYRMWREMMSAFALMQTPGLKIAVCRPADQPGYWDLARDHFGCQIPLVGYESPTQVLAEVRANPTTLGVVPAPDRGRHRAMVAAAGEWRVRPCPTSWPACPSSSCPMPARAASRPSCWPASSPRKAAMTAR